MIITQTPLRISFVGGTTDIADYYHTGYGAVVSTAIDKYIYITVKKMSPLAPHKMRISYAKTENVSSVEEIEHPIVKEALQYLEIDEPLEISVIADVPARTGLGSSSTFTVGLLHALHALKGEYVSPEQLAKEACHIEIERLNRPIGKQDQYAAAYGGMNQIKFMADESVRIEPIVIRREVREELFGNLMMFYTGVTRDAHEILSKQKSGMHANKEIQDRMRDMTNDATAILADGKDLDAFGKMLDKAWKLKVKMSDAISSQEISGYYDRATKAGALGGKILGAGGGGFLLFYVPKNAQGKVREALQGLLQMPVDFEPEGSRIVFYR